MDRRQPISYSFFISLFIFILTQVSTCAINKPSQAEPNRAKPTYRRLPPLLDPDFLRGANVEAGVVGAKEI